MVDDILFALWFMLPAAAANSIPVFVAAVPFLKDLDAPIDGNMKFRGHALLGPHKTWRGLIAGIIVATLVLWLQQLAASHFTASSGFMGSIDYASLPTLIVGPLFAIGALGGDAIESFFKRQRGIKSGGTWVPFDQIDYIVGAIIATLPFVVLSISQYLWILVIWFLIHLAATYIGWRIGLKKDPI